MRRIAILQIHVDLPQSGGLGNKRRTVVFNIFHSSWTAQNTVNSRVEGPQMPVNRESMIGQDSQDLINKENQVNYGLNNDGLDDRSTVIARANGDLAEAIFPKYPILPVQIITW